jgi:hypothetical protein
LARRLLNDKVVFPGGTWAVRRGIVDCVRQRAGYFASPQHLEFFAMRGAACLAERAAIVDSPLMILGRHAKSSSTVAYLPRKWLGSRRWDWSFEDPHPYRHSPFPWKAYCTLSLDGAMHVKERYPEELAGVEIDWPRWTDLIFREAADLMRIGQLPPSVMREFFKAVSKIPGQRTSYWRWRWARKRIERPWRSFQEISRPWRHAWRWPETGFLQRGTNYGWTDRIHGAKMGFANIVEAADWFAANRPADVPRAQAA